MTDNRTYLLFKLLGGISLCNSSAASVYDIKIDNGSVTNKSKIKNYEFVI